MEVKKEYDEKTYEKVEEMYKMMENKEDYDMGVNNNDVATLGLAGAVGYGGGYGGYGRSGSEVGNGILFNQNDQNGRDILQGTCSTQRAVAQANVDNNNAGALREVSATLNANSNQARTDDKFATSAASDATFRLTSLMNNNDQHSAIREQFAISETKLDLLCNKLNAVEVNAMGREIASMQTASILAGQKSIMLESQLKDFCCPKPSAKYEVVGCGCSNGGSSSSAPQITVIDIVNIVKAINDGGRPGNS